MAVRQKMDLVENPDILATIAHRNHGRPKIVVGFAAETNDVLAHARKKLDAKGCDIMVANDVSPSTGHYGRRHEYDLHRDPRRHRSGRHSIRTKWRAGSLRAWPETSPPNDIA